MPVPAAASWRSRPGAEALAGAGDDHAAHVAVALGRGEVLGQLARACGTEMALRRCGRLSVMRGDVAVDLVEDIGAAVADGRSSAMPGSLAPYVRSLPVERRVETAVDRIDHHHRSGPRADPRAAGRRGRRRRPRACASRSPASGRRLHLRPGLRAPRRGRRRRRPLRRPGPHRAHPGRQRRQPPGRHPRPAVGLRARAGSCCATRTGPEVPQLGDHVELSGTAEEKVRAAPRPAGQPGPRRPRRLRHAGEGRRARRPTSRWAAAARAAPCRR